VGQTVAALDPQRISPHIAAFTQSFTSDAWMSSPTGKRGARNTGAIRPGEAFHKPRA
jgi:hypothetical protein